MESESKFYPNFTNFTLILRSYENTFCVQKEKKNIKICYLCVTLASFWRISTEQKLRTHFCVSLITDLLLSFKSKRKYM